MPDQTADPPPGQSAAQSDADSRMPYLPALDGIRALAVLAVVIFHTSEAWLSAGFLGVDVFFVVSGFLITALLVAERERAGRVDLRAFWIRRARRLLPALALVLAATTIYAVLLLGDQLLSHLREVFAAVVYVTNWDLILRDVSYFESFDRPSQLRHLWSLAVEEQFYLLWPLVFAGLSRFVSRRLLLAIVLLLAGASLAWMIQLYTPGEDPSRVYFGSDPRAFTILIGVALGLVWRPWRWQWPEQRRLPCRLLDLIGLAGLAAVVLIMQQGHWREAWLYPWGLLGASVASAALIAAVARRRWVLGRALGAGPLRWLGTRSYGVYLWHWPVLLALSFELDLSGVALFAAGAPISAALAEASYRWVETPIRRGEFRLRLLPPRAQTVALSAAAAAVFAAAIVGLVLLEADDSSALENFAVVIDAEGAAAAEAAQPESSFIAAAAPEAEADAASDDPPPLIISGASSAPAESTEEDHVAEIRRRWQLPEARLADAEPPVQSPAAPLPPGPTASDPERTALAAADIDAEISPELSPQIAPATAFEFGLLVLPPELEQGRGSAQPAEPPLFTYVVRAGDSPHRIARTFGTTAERLVELNGEQIMEVVHAGDMVIVPCPDRMPCAVIEIATRGPGCVSWSSRLGEERVCRGVGALIGLPAAFAAEGGLLASPTVWEWDGASVQADTFELRPDDVDDRSGTLIVRFGIAPLAIGDSVMVGAARMLSERGLDVDAVGARTAYRSMQALERHLAEGPREAVVFHGVGYEFVDEQDFERLMRIAEDVDHLIVLTRQFPQRDPWIRLERDGNRMLREGAARHAKVTLIDWHQVTDGREDELTYDGTHLRPLGLQIYVQMIVEAIEAGPSSSARRTTDRQR